MPNIIKIYQFTKHYCVDAGCASVRKKNAADLLGFAALVSSALFYFKGCHLEQVDSLFCNETDTHTVTTIPIIVRV